MGDKNWMENRNFTGLGVPLLKVRPKLPSLHIRYLQQRPNISSIYANYANNATTRQQLKVQKERQLTARALFYSPINSTAALDC